MEIGTYIFLGIIVIIIIGPSVILHIGRRYNYWRSVKESMSKPFVCSNCGERFYAKQKTLPLFVGDEKAYLKCPKCKKRSICKRPYDMDIDEK